MKKIIIFLAIGLFWCIGAQGQTKGFLELYEKAGIALKRGEPGITTVEISGKMLQELMPSKAKENFNIVNRIDMIRQIKFAAGADTELFRKIEELTAGGGIYERMSLMNVDGQRVDVYKAPYGNLKSEYLILISKDGAALACSITGNISMKDIMNLLYGTVK